MAKENQQDLVLEGLACSPGIAIGTIRRLLRPSVDGEEITAQDPRLQCRRLHQALRAAAESISALKRASAERLGERELEIFDTYLMILEDEDWLGAIYERIGKGMTAEQAVDQTCRELAEEFAGLDSEYLRERASDMLDIGRLVTRHLCGGVDLLADLVRGGESLILVAEEINPSEISALAGGQVVGIITERGGTHSHFAILARALSIPTVVGVKSGLDILKDGDKAILDGDLGQIILHPSSETFERYRLVQEEEKKLAVARERFRWSKTFTADGKKILVEANLDSAEDADRIKEIAVDGIGLFRTEFLFMNSEGFPDEETQYTVYRQVAEKLNPLPVTFRTLDVGGDKPLPYYPIRESNPFLGYRGIRISLSEPDIFRIQLRALYRASQTGNIKIMFPMVQGVEDFRRAKIIAEELRTELGCRYVPIGCMVEVPSAIWMIKELLEEADFISIGTNDLTQYILAADRQNERASSWYRPFHPAVLRAISQIVVAARHAGKDVTVCGEMAGDPVAIPVLVGMGVTGLSMSYGRLLKAKAVISSMRADEVELLVEDLLREAKTWEDVMQMLDRPFGRE